VPRRSLPSPHSNDRPSLTARHHWYVAEAEPRREALAIEHLERQSFRCFYPTFTKIRRHARRVDTVRVPLFPGYIFISFDAERDEWRSINGTRGVRRLLTSEWLRPTPMPGHAIAPLLELSNDDALSVGRAVCAGDRVIIVSGPFAEQIATVEALDDRGRVQLLFEILGGRVRLCVGRASVVSA
jgi:transcriptional antiterminator RfaH